MIKLTLGWSEKAPQATRPRVFVMPMIERSKEADSLSAPSSTARAARYMKGTKKPKKVMKLETQSTSNVKDLNSENWIIEERTRT